MFRKQNLTPQELRDKFLKIAAGEGWFSDDYQITQSEQSRPAAAAAASFSEYDAGVDNFQRVELLFGPPPYEFLEPGDAPDRFIRNDRLGRKLVRNPRESEYKAMRQTHVNYNSLPSVVQFYTSDDPAKTHHLWLPGSGTVKTAKDLERLLIAQDDSEEGYLTFNYRRPRGSEVEHIVPGDRLSLWVKRGSKFVELGEILVDEFKKEPRAATGQVMARLTASE